MVYYNKTNRRLHREVENIILLMIKHLKNKYLSKN